MRGIAMAIIGATLVWLHVAVFRESGDVATPVVSAVMMLAWFAATVIVIAIGL